MKINVTGYLGNCWTAKETRSRKGNTIYPSMKTTNNGKQYLSNSIATYNGKDGEGKTIYKYIKFTVWEQPLIDMFMKYTKKDAYITIDGFLKLTDTDTKTYLDVTVKSLIIMPPKKDIQNKSEFSGEVSPVDKVETTAKKDIEFNDDINWDGE